jgi:hypothetical protein
MIIQVIENNGVSIEGVDTAQLAVLSAVNVAGKSFKLRGLAA